MEPRSPQAPNRPLVAGDAAPEGAADGDLVPGADGAALRVERDSLGPVLVPAERLWGAQTQRALGHFAIGDQRMPLAVIHAYGVLKAAAARANRSLGTLPDDLAALVEQAALEVAAGTLDEHFPLSLWQSGSGTQTNMNVNEVIANRATQVAGGVVGSRRPVHPNDHVNRSQSTNDTFPTAMHVATVAVLSEALLPAVTGLVGALREKAVEWVDVVKIGRTHLQDATPLTVGQEWSAWIAQLEGAARRVAAARDELLELAVGGTAVGTGVSSPPGFGEAVAAELARRTGFGFRVAPNRFAALAGLDAMVAASASLRGLAVVLHKVANDLRWLGSGPRSGLGELHLPDNEPGSSIMPGKVNPTQEEAVIMVCFQVMGDDAAVALAGASGTLQLNVTRPLVIGNVLRSAVLLTDACDSLAAHGIAGIELDRARIEGHVAGSLMLVTALAPEIGYDRAAAIAHDALARGVTLRDAALAAGVAPADYDRLVVPSAMVGDPHRDLGLA